MTALTGSVNFTTSNLVDSTPEMGNDPEKSVRQLFVEKSRSKDMGALLKIEQCAKEIQSKCPNATYEEACGLSSRILSVENGYCSLKEQGKDDSSIAEQIKIVDQIYSIFQEQHKNLAGCFSLKYHNASILLTEKMADMWELADVGMCLDESDMNVLKELLKDFSSSSNESSSSTTTN